MLMSKEDYKAVCHFLQILSPSIQRDLPLKVGIYDEICRHPQVQSSSFTHEAIRNFLRIHMSHESYLKNILSRNVRYNLNGHVDGEITKEQRLFAKAKLKKLTRQKQLRAAKRKTPASIKPRKDRLGRPILTIRKNRAA
ncbi:MAG: ProQ/FINO family protein [Pseudomonadota bacterium]